MSDAAVALRWKQVEQERSEAPTLFADDELVERHVGLGEYRGLEFLHVNARRMLNRVPEGSPVPFRWTVNPYRGCSHACVYCFARPTHEYLGLDLASDFDSKIVVKVNAVEALRVEVRHPAWRREHVALGTNTDPYQKAEGRYRLTRSILQVLADSGTPFSVLTKSTLVLRDLDVLREAAARVGVRCNLSIGTLDPDVWRLTEPGTPHPLRRMEAVARLNQAGIACGVLMGPVIPGLSDLPGMVEQVAEAAVEAGAVSVSAVALHLRPKVREHVMGWVRRERPDLHAEWSRRYDTRSTLPAADQRALAERVGGAVYAARRRLGRLGRASSTEPIGDLGDERMVAQGLGPGRGLGDRPPCPDPVEQLTLAW